MYYFVCDANETESKLNTGCDHRRIITRKYIT